MVAAGCSVVQIKISALSDRHAAGIQSVVVGQTLNKKDYQVESS